MFVFEVNTYITYKYIIERYLHGINIGIIFIIQLDLLNKHVLNTSRKVQFT